MNGDRGQLGLTCVGKWKIGRDKGKICRESGCGCRGKVINGGG